MNIIISLT